MAEASLSADESILFEPSSAGATSSELGFSDIVDKALETLSFEEKGVYQWWRNGKSNLRILAVGKTGVGKSTLLNGLFGVAESSDKFKVGSTLKPGTTCVCTREYIRSGILLVVHDCPGLEDRTGKEADYLKEMKAKKAEGIDLMLYCISMKETRADLSSAVNQSAIDKFSKELGSDIWEHTVFVLTCANVHIKTIRDSDAGDTESSVQVIFEKRMNEWRMNIAQALIKNGVDETIANNVQVVPAGYHKKKSLLDRKYWLSDLWACVFVAVSDKGKLAFIKLSENRLKKPSEVTDDDFKHDIHEQPIVISSTLPISTYKEKNKALELLSRLWQKICDFVHHPKSKCKVDLSEKQHGHDYNTWM